MKASVRSSQQSNQIMQREMQETQCTLRQKDELDGFLEEKSIQPPDIMSFIGCSINLYRFFEQLFSYHPSTMRKRVQESQSVGQQHPVRLTSKPLIIQKARFEDENTMKQGRLRPHEKDFPRGQCDGQYVHHSNF